MVDHLRPVGDVAAYAGAIASICGFLQPIAAFIASLLSILWLCVQFRDRQRKKKEGA